LLVSRNRFQSVLFLFRLLCPGRDNADVACSIKHFTMRKHATGSHR
jgi:hypothetical protein